MINLPNGLSAADLRHIYGPEQEREIVCTPEACDERAVQSISVRCAECGRRVCADCLHAVEEQPYCPVHPTKVAPEDEYCFGATTDRYVIVSDGLLIAKVYGHRYVDQALQEARFRGIEMQAWAECEHGARLYGRSEKAFVRGGPVVAAQQGADAISALSERGAA